MSLCLLGARPLAGTVVRGALWLVPSCLMLATPALSYQSGPAFPQGLLASAPDPDGPTFEVSLREVSPFLPSDGILQPAEPAGRSGATGLEGGPGVTVPDAEAALRRSPHVPPLPVLEAAFVGLQALDVLTTLGAVRRGLAEANPLMRGVVRHPAAFIGVKAAAAVTTLWLVRRVARTNRLAAVITLGAIDSGYAMLAARNMRALRRFE